MSDCNHPDPETLNAIYCKKCGAWRLRKEDPVVYCFGAYTAALVGNGWWKVTSYNSDHENQAFVDPGAKEKAIAEARRLASAQGFEPR